jgi:serine phosphatase RsbU (regulator of sigma subunit)
MATSTALEKIKPSDLPSPPQAAIEIMRACSRKDVSNLELSRIAGSDPQLTAELLRVVNSPFFGMANKIQSIPRAVTVLGQRALRNLVLCVSVRDSVRGDAIPGFDTTQYWEDALRRAVAARMLGQLLRLDVDECFTAGLLQDFGMLVMIYLQPEWAGMWSELHQQDPVSRYSLEQDTFGNSHDKVIKLLAQNWALPEELAIVLGGHHSCDDMALTGDQAKLCKILYSSDWMAAVFSASDKGLVLDHCRSVLPEYFELSTQQIEEILAVMPEQVEEAATALGLHVEQQQDFEQIMREANARLAEENTSYQELTWKLEKALKERDFLAEELNRELELAREIQQSLQPKDQGDHYPLTGINISAKELSGDFYDFFSLPDGRIYFNIGDVSGKGINASLLMAKTSSLFHCLGKQVHDPSSLMAQINDEICETTIRGMFITMIAGLYNPKTSDLCLVNAGNPPAIMLYANGKLDGFKAEAPPLGVLPGAEFPKKELNLKGGSLYMFSDGVTEGRVASGKMLGLRGFMEMIKELSRLAPKEQLETMVGHFHESSEPIRDDITILLLKDGGYG